MRHISVTYPKRVASLNVETTSNFNRRNPVGVVFLSFNDPSVVQPLAGQPWARGRCPVGAWTDEESCIGESAARNAYWASIIWPVEYPSSGVRIKSKPTASTEMRNPVPG